MRNIAIFASGGGSNAEAIITHFNQHPTVTVRCIVCNNPKAGVIQRAKHHQIELKPIDRGQFYESQSIVPFLEDLQIEFIALAGFLWLIPRPIIDAFKGRMVNIHPALLPKFGGKGMYGMHVHRAVLEQKENVSGMTVHWVTEKYDEGKPIFQASCNVLDSDTADDVAKKVLKLEHQFYPLVLEGLLYR